MAGSATHLVSAWSSNMPSRGRVSLRAAIHLSVLDSSLLLCIFSGDGRVMADSRAAKRAEDAEDEQQGPEGGDGQVHERLRGPR